MCLSVFLAVSVNISCDKLCQNLTILTSGHPLVCVCVFSYRITITLLNALLPFYDSPTCCCSSNGPSLVIVLFFVLLLSTTNFLLFERHTTSYKCVFVKSCVIWYFFPKKKEISFLLSFAYYQNVVVVFYNFSSWIVIISFQTNLFSL